MGKGADRTAEEAAAGGGIVIDGVLFRGAHGLAGEIGHMAVPGPDGTMRNLEELIGLSDRLLVIFDGRIVADMSPDEATPEKLGTHMTGSTVEAGT